ncbi:hypothetical protein BH09VER1_BH09VER1_47200 [soil metagenome]
MRSPSDNPSRIGCHCWGTSAASIEALRACAGLGVGWVRATRPMQLDVVADGPGRYDWARGGERSIDLACEKGVSVLGILDGRWGNETGINKLPWCSPIWDHLDAWCDFVAAAVSHYKDRVHHWEVLNEPPFFWWYPPAAGESFAQASPKMKRAPVRHYASLLQATARTIRACDPGATIVAGSGFSDAYLLRQLYQLGCRDFFDVASVHYLPCHHPEAFQNSYRALRTVMAEYGDQHKPLWDTESGPAGAIIGLSIESSKSYEALYSIYRHCFAHQFGLDRYFWFNSIPNGQPNDHGIPVHRDSTQLSVPYQALATLIAQVGHRSLLAHEHSYDDIHLYIFEGPVSIVWTTATAVAHIPGGATASDFLGQSQNLPEHFPLDAHPLYFPDDIRSLGFKAHVAGPRLAVRPCRPDKCPTDATPHKSSFRVSQALSLNDRRWLEVPVFTDPSSLLPRPRAPHLCSLPAGLPAELRLAHDDQNLYLRCQIWDDLLDLVQPAALLQFALRDSDPAIPEWPHFLNGYGLFNLHISHLGDRFLRYDHLRADQYSSGAIPNIPVFSVVSENSLIVTTAIPWHELGPLRPGRHNPFFASFTTSRCDELLDIPQGGDPAEWSHNFIDPFILNPSVQQAWIEFT